MSARGSAATALIEDATVDHVAVEEAPSASEAWDALCTRLGSEACQRCDGHGRDEQRDPDGRPLGVWVECDSCHGSGRVPRLPRAISLRAPASSAGPSEIPF